jgi:hypothetical protein
VAAAANADQAQRPLVAWLYYQPANPDWGIYGREQIAVQFAAYMTEYALVRFDIMPQLYRCSGLACTPNLCQLAAWTVSIASVPSFT